MSKLAEDINSLTADQPNKFPNIEAISIRAEMLQEGDIFNIAGYQYSVSDVVNIPVNLLMRMYIRPVGGRRSDIQMIYIGKDRPMNVLRVT